MMVNPAEPTVSSLRPHRIGFVSTRFAGTDGVSLETAKWATILERLGHECFYFAGECDRPSERSHVVPEAFYQHPEIRTINDQVYAAGPPAGAASPAATDGPAQRHRPDARPRDLTERIHALRELLKIELRAFVDRFELDLLVIENASAIPLNLPLGLAISEFVAESALPVIAHHHDFHWERQRFLVNSVPDILASAFPPTHAAIRHVVINSVQARELARRAGLTARVIPNVMEFERPPEPPATDPARVRADVGILPGELLILQPTRVIPRKGIEHAIEFTRRLGRPARLVVSHASGDEGPEYEQRLREYAQLLGVDVRFEAELIGDRHGITADGRRVHTLADVYPAADFVTYPSAFEGFGNAFLEAVYYRRPILVNNYSTYEVDIRPRGFQVVWLDGFISDAAMVQARGLLDNPAEAAAMGGPQLRPCGAALLVHRAAPAPGRPAARLLRPGGRAVVSLRVGLLHFTAPPVVGGVETVLGRQARLLAGAGHRVRIIAGRGSAHGGGVEHVRVPLADCRNGSIRAAHRALDRGVIPPDFEPLVAQLADGLRRAFEGLDLVIAHNVCSLNVNVPLTAALARVIETANSARTAEAGETGRTADMIDGPRFVAWDHDIGAAQDHYRARLHPGYPWDLFRRPWAKVTLVTISEARRAALVDAIGVERASIRVVPDGIDHDGVLAIGRVTRRLVDALALREAQPVLLAPARITPRKNLELGIRVCGELRRGGEDARLVITGTPDTHDRGARGYLAHLRALASASSPASGIHFLADGPPAWRSERVISDLFRVADALFLPSFDEGFGLPLLEAAACRLPVICADIPALRELAGEDATYIDPRGAPADVAAVVRRRLGADPAYRFACRTRTTNDWSPLFARQIEPLLLEVAAG